MIYLVSAKIECLWKKRFREESFALSIDGILARRRGTFCEKVIMTFEEIIKDSKYLIYIIQLAFHQRRNASIAQLGERQTEDLKVLCSIHSQGKH